MFYFQILVILFYKIVTHIFQYLHLKNVLKGENMIKYTFRDPCQEKCKVTINQALTN
jgi:hypothetical protein